TAPAPTVTVAAPCVAPKPLPQMVTQTPLLLWPPALGPLSKSEKKMRGGAACAHTNPADNSKANNEPIFEPIFKNLSIGTPTWILCKAKMSPGHFKGRE